MVLKTLIPNRANRFSIQKSLFIVFMILEKLPMSMGKTSIATPPQRKSANCTGSTSSCIYLPMIKFADQNSTHRVSKSGVFMMYLLVYCSLIEIIIL